MDVYVGQAVAEEVVEEGDVEEAALHPVALGVAEHEVDGGHEEDVETDEDEQGVVFAGPEGVGVEDEDEEPPDDLEEEAEEEDGAVEESGEVLVQGASLQGGVVGGEAPRQAGQQNTS